MIKNKRGLSAIITTLLVVLLVLVAVGIVWGVVSGVLRRGSEDLEYGAKCLNVEIMVTGVACSDITVPADGELECNVSLSRTGTETDALGGVKLVFRDSTAETNSGVIDDAGEVVALAGRTITDVATTLTSPDSVEVTAYFLDGSGNEKLCTQTTTEVF